MILLKNDCILRSRDIFTRDSRKQRHEGDSQEFIYESNAKNYCLRARIRHIVLIQVPPDFLMPYALDSQLRHIVRSV